MDIIRINSNSRDELIDISSKIQQITTEADFKDGLVIVYCPHTTAGLTINEGADPAVKGDIISCLDGFVPWQGNYNHLEGNSAAHVKASLMGSSATLLVEDGLLILGRWQKLFFCEFDGPKPREIYVKFLKSE